MEVDILIYFSIAVIIGVMLIGFASYWNFRDDSENLAKFYYDEDSGREFSKVTVNDFAVAAYEYFKLCNYSALAYNESYYVYPDKRADNAMNKSELFQIYKGLEWCGTIQSANHSCGYREDVDFNSSSIPDIFEISCQNQTLHIRSVS